MGRTLFLIILAGLQFSCSIYSSAGRKDFESKSPDYVKTLSFVGCEPVSQADFDEGFLQSFSSRTFFTNDDFWVAQENETPNIQVLDHKKARVCSYQFASREEWAAQESYFLQHLP